ncbi:MAG: L-threonylcarbamoyladenylate synthase [Cyanobacteriota bacterium]
MENSYFLTHNETLNIETALSKTDGVIAFPTDTVYGLGCLIENEDAVKKIYSLKGRSSEKPLILMGSSVEVFEKYVKFIPEIANTLMKKHWPGALTIVLPKSRFVPDFITTNTSTVGLRIANHPLVNEILKRCTKDLILATTSANYSDQPDLVTYEDVKKLLGEKVDYLLEDYNIPISGKASTVIAINQDNSIKVLRQGSIVID